MRQVAQVDQELFPHGLIQMEALHQHGFHRRVLGLFTGKRSAGDGVHGKKGDGRNDEYGKDCKQYTLDDISEHPDESLPKARRKALRAAKFSSFPRGAKTKPHGLDRAAALYIGRFEGSMQK